MDEATGDQDERRGTQRSLPHGDRTPTGRATAPPPPGGAARPPRQGPLPGLCAAAAACTGAVCGPWLASRDGDLHGLTLIAALVVPVTVLAILTMRRRPPVGRALLLLVLAALCAGRAALAAAARPPAPGASTVGHVQRPRGQAGAGRGTEAWTLSGQQGLLITPRGTLLPGDLVAVKAGARRADRARSLHRPITPRSSSLRPRADELVRAPSEDRAQGRAPSGTGWTGGIAGLRARGLAACFAHPDAACAGLLGALVFGDRGGLDRGVTDLFTRTGTRHLLALSGFHVGLLAWLMVLPAARWISGLLRHGAALGGSPWRPDAALLSAAMVLTFVPLSGGGAPATRAAIGLTLALLSRRLQRRPSVLNLIGVAALAEVAIDPLAPLRAGTQLSYLATLALLLSAAPITRALAGRGQGPPDVRGWLDPVSRTGWPRPPIVVALVERTRGLCYAALAAGAVASLATLPVIWSVFGEWSPASLIATPIATPPVALLVVIGWLRLALPLPGLDEAARWAADGLLAWLHLIDRLPWTPLPLPERPAWLLVVATSLVGLAAVRVGQPPARRLAALGALGFGALLLPWPGPNLAPSKWAPGPIPQTFEVHILDVGNGTAIVARAPGAPTWLLDAGSRDRLAVAEEGVGALLRALDTGTIQVGVSHDHEDHAGAIPWVVDRWPADLFHGPRRQHDAAQQRTHPRGLVWLGASSGAAGATSLQVGAISSGLPDPNEGSATFDLRWRSPDGASARVVLCGDAEGRGLRAILDGGGEDPWLEPGPVDLLLLPHHGSETRHLARLLDRLQPALAVVSGDVPEDLGEFARRGVPLHVTGRDGPLLWRPQGRP